MATCIVCVMEIWPEIHVHKYCKEARIRWSPSEEHMDVVEDIAVTSIRTHVDNSIVFVETLTHMFRPLVSEATDPYAQKSRHPTKSPIIPSK